jgi:tetratricopeptide (TPR) repeat protein
MQIDSGRISAYQILANVYAARGRWAELEQVLETSEKEVPDNLLPHYMAARTLLLAGKDLPRAEGYFRKYLSQEPEGGAPPLAAAHWRLGQVLEKEGKKAESIKEIQTGVDLKPGLAQQNLEEAKKDLKRLKG